jgi:hypothetical protein
MSNEKWPINCFTPSMHEKDKLACLRAHTHVPGRILLKLVIRVYADGCRLKRV